MLLTAHQPNYLPYAGFFHKVAQADRFIIVDTTQFVKRGPFGWIHRNKIRTAEGWQWLSVPVHTSGKFTQPIHQTLIRNDLPWRRKHWRAIEFNYRAAPHFSRYAGGLQAIYDREWNLLSDLNAELIRFILHALEIETPVSLAGAAGIEGKATELVINLCRAAGADAYLSGVHGHDYLDEAAVRAAGIDLRFQQFEPPVYPQCHPGPFVTNLSVLDLLLNVGPGARALLTGGSH